MKAANVLHELISIAKIVDGQKQSMETIKMLNMVYIIIPALLFIL